MEEKWDEINTRVLKKELVFVVVVALEGMLDLRFLARSVEVQPQQRLVPSLTLWYLSHLISLPLLSLWFIFQTGFNHTSLGIGIVDFESLNMIKIYYISNLIWITYLYWNVFSFESAQIDFVAHKFLKYWEEYFSSQTLGGWRF